MGQCGCGDFSAWWQMPGPDAIVYAVELYGGCEDCDTPVAVRLYRMDEDRDFWVDDLPEIPIMSYAPADTSQDGELFLPVLHPNALEKLLVKAMGSWKILDDDGEEWTAAEYYEKTMREIRSDLADYAYKEWRKIREMQRREDEQESDTRPPAID